LTLTTGYCTLGSVRQHLLHALSGIVESIHMSEHKVDLSQIRGDWHFHSRYVTNAMDQTLKRLQKTWRALKARAPAAGEVAMDGALMEEFLEACRQTRGLTDDIRLMSEARPAQKAAPKPRKAGRKQARARAGARK
jgi:hypothetical protein